VHRKKGQELRQVFRRKPRGMVTAMNPRKVERSRTRKLTDLPNVGTATARDLQLIGIRVPEDLRDRDPLQLYERLCQRTGVRQDLCVLDVYMSITDYVDVGRAAPLVDV